MYVWGRGGKRNMDGYVDGIECDRGKLIFMVTLPPILDHPAGTSVGDRGDTAGSHDVSVEVGEGGEEVDDGDDVEYIYPADQQPEEEKEELRNDRAVKIPRELSRQHVHNTIACAYCMICTLKETC